ncbi:hypothetical protein [Methylobacterium sp. J-068]|uniref:hypothetical protein n=1 Tax=Methylobacterium sp. J-068 TaxID=2836649 RepID=UPI001FBAE356|nr:hypothetical protein [Methylobacterium sp. J-068]MCJ2032884.1 hypothetical protein [Methylobacterium sp. J-068]
MEFTEGPQERKEFTLPPLTAEQLIVVSGALGSVLHLTFMAYGHGIGADRIHELEEFSRGLLLGIKNVEIGGLAMNKEPAVIETVHAIVAAAIPNVKRIG